MARHTGVLGGAKIIVGNVHVGVTDPAVLQPEGDVCLPPLTPLESQSLEGGALASPAPARGGIHAAVSLLTLGSPLSLLQYL